MNNVQRSLDIVLYINDIAVAGQEGATLNRAMSPIDITNKITGSWKESLGGLKSWSVACNGSYVKNANSLMQLEQAFMNNDEIDIKLILNTIHYKGKALITDFPLNAVYNDQFKYNITLLGTGELKLVDEDNE